MLYKGSCHCGRVRYEVDGEMGQVMECNCSHCSRKGYLLWFVGREQLRVTEGESTLAVYMFNKHVIEHCFCPNCGCAPFGRGLDAKGVKRAAINVRCLEGIELSTLNRMQVDGRSR
jgi:hypothetical protein